MTRPALLKTLVGSAVLILGSSGADAYYRIIKDKNLSCTYSDAKVGHGGVPVVTLRLHGKVIYPKGTGYIVTHVNPDGKIEVKLGRELSAVHPATVPINENWGTSPSQCSVEVVLDVDITVPSGKRF